MQPAPVLVVPEAVIIDFEQVAHTRRFFALVASTKTESNVRGSSKAKQITLRLS